MLKKIFIFFLLILFNQPGWSVSSIEYVLSMPQPHNHYFQVEMIINDPDQEILEVSMPVWAPGSYLVREFSRNVEDFKAFAGSNQLAAEKTDKNTWRIRDIRQQDQVRITYQVYAFEISVRTSFLDATHGYVNGTSVFMYTEGYLDVPIKLKVIPYQEWNKVSTGLNPVPGQSWTYQAPDYDILADSPIEIGNHEVITFEAAGVKHEVAMYGPGNYDIAQVKKDLAKIAELSTNIFGQNPNDYYLYIIHNLDSRGGGLEHINSTTLQLDRWGYEPYGRYRGFLSLAAHEYFHLWLVKRIRPESLGPFNYEKENYTHLLWVMEGFTSYYDELLLLRGKYYSVNEYLGKLASSITNIENTPGNHVQPVAMASLDAWIKFYRPDENSPNTSISYYTKGAVLASLLDLEIMHSTNGSKSLDDVLKTLFSQYQKDKQGISGDEFQQVVEEVAGKNLDDFFQDYVYGTESIDYDKYFGYAGLHLINVNETSSDAYLGLRTRQTNGKLMVSNVFRGSAAYRDGVNVNDEIIAIDGYRLSDANELNQMIARKKPGDVINMMIVREGLVRELSVTVGKDTLKSYSFLRMADPTEKQTKIFRKWLNQD